MNYVVSIIKTLLLPVLLFLISMQALSIDRYENDWICENVASKKTGNRYLICGVATSRSESLARKTALENAYLEFDQICNRSYRCRGKEIEPIPHRNECARVNGGFRCLRSLTIDVLDENKRDVKRDLMEANNDLILIEKQYTEAKQVEAKKRRVLELEKRIADKDFEDAIVYNPNFYVGLITGGVTHLTISVGRHSHGVEASSPNYGFEDYLGMSGVALRAQYDLTGDLSPFVRYAKSSVDDSTSFGDSISANQTLFEIGTVFYPFNDSSGYQLTVGISRFQYEVNEVVSSIPKADSSGTQYGFTFGGGYRFRWEKIVADVIITGDRTESVGFRGFSGDLMIGVPF